MRLAQSGESQGWGSSSRQPLSWDEIARHNTADDLWMVIGRTVQTPSAAAARSRHCVCGVGFAAAVVVFVAAFFRCIT
jgi:hypothetical protein